MKFCKDCKFSILLGTESYLSSSFVCSHPRVRAENTNLVTGNTFNEYCEKLRVNLAVCGKEAILFEAKNETM